MSLPILFGVSLLAFHGQPTSSGLDQSISLHEVQTPIFEVVQHISRSIGILVTAGDDIQDRSVNVICKHRSAREVLAEMCSCLMLQLVPNGKGYKLRLEPLAANEEQEHVSLEDAELLRATGTALSRLGAYSFQNHEELVLARNAAIRAANDPSSNGAERAAAISKLGDLLDDGLLSAAAALRTRTDEAAHELWSGNELVLSSLGTSPTSHIELNQFSQLIFQGQSHDAKFAAVKISLLADVAELQVEEALDYAWHPAPGALDTEPPKRFKLAPTPTVSKFSARLETWVKEGDADLRSVRLAHEREVLPPGGYRSGWVTLSEHAAFIAEAYDVPVVADATRFAATPPERTNAPDLGAYIDHLKQKRLIGGFENARPGIVRMRHGWLQFRQNHFWRMKYTAIPEKLLRPLEKRYGAGESLTELDYAPLIASLDPIQAEAIAQLSFLLRIPHMPLYKDRETIKFLSSLNGAELARLKGGGLSATDLGPRQQNALLHLLEQVVFAGGVEPTIAAACLSGSFANRQVTLTYTIEREEAKPFMGDGEWSPQCGTSPWVTTAASRFKLNVAVDDANASTSCRIDTVFPVPQPVRNSGH